jgi:hypothetical protein
MLKVKRGQCARRKSKRQRIMNNVAILMLKLQNARRLYVQVLHFLLWWLLR